MLIDCYMQLKVHWKNCDTIFSIRNLERAEDRLTMLLIKMFQLPTFFMVVSKKLADVADKSEE